ncbi:hypothetical protein PYW08_012389 [Mythimna loreyi]|uniref:Uncharacterized protein n=1 Tax=Mythimna loreyi TaxID=667449 RepID=A0ACC2Q0J0_9NEOP|nr:hypothetical protein PYW08_012389 [Mythimna loreyi]
MEKMLMCRICLVENVRMYTVNNKDLQELYETLTNIPFVTEDRRPMLACVFCFAKLKQCCQLQKKCLEAENRFAQMMNEPNTPVNHGQLEYSSVPTEPPAENIRPFETVIVKEELPDVCERLDDVIEPKVEFFEYELELEPLNNSYSETEERPAQQSKSDAVHNVPLMKIKTELEEEPEEPTKKRRVSDTTRAVVANKQNLQIRVRKLEEVISEIQKKNEEANSKATQNTPCSSSELIAKYQESLANTTARANISVALDTNYRNNTKKGNIKKHIRVNTGEKPFKCEVCQLCFSQNVHLTRHMRTHTGDKPYKCEECQHCFNQKVHLTNHLRTHTGIKPYKCEECQLCFSRKDYLTRHMRTHTGEKPYKCEECQLCFSQKFHLTRHTRTHTGEKPYKCEECQIFYSEKVDFTRHLLTHTGEKPYKCEECQLSFSHKITLLRHIRTHTGEKPYKCEQCQLCFNQEATLIRHIRTHSDEPLQM